MADSIVIDRRFRGPPESGNGGYVCGLVAGRMGGAAEVTLRLPPPLGRPLAVRRLGDGAVEMYDDETLIAEGTPAVELDLDLPKAVSFAQAEQASRDFPAYHDHIFPSCFVCGPDRAKGDGLRIFPGPVPGRPLVAAPWVPDASVCERGVVRPEIVWAALDCPSGFAVVNFYKETAVLGRLAARLRAPPAQGGRYVIAGWPLGSERRKQFSGSALFSADGEVLACARATWVKLA